MPAMLPAVAASTALGSGVAVGAFGAGIGSAALGTGLAAGSALASGAGLAGLMGGLGGAGAVAPGAFGALAPAAMAKLAPAAAAQAAGTIGTIGGSVAPGAFGANLAGAAAPGLTGTVGSVAPGAFGANLAGAGQGLAGAANPTLASQYAAAKQQAALRSAQLGNQTTGMGFQKAATTSPYDLSAGFKQGLDPRVLQQPSLSNPTVSPLSTTQAANPADIVGRSIRPNQNFMQNLGNISSFQDVKDYADMHPYATSAMAGLGAMGISKMMQPKKVPTPEDESMIRPYTYNRSQRPEAYAVSPTEDSSERLYFNDQFIAGEPYKAAEGGIAAAYAIGGAVEDMAAQNAVGSNTGYPMAYMQTPMYSDPSMQRPQATNVVAPSADTGVGMYTGEARFMGGGITTTTRSKEPETTGGYSYSYDPATMQFTQTGAPQPVTTGRGNSLSAALYSANGGPAFMGPVSSGSSQYNNGPAFMGPVSSGISNTPATPTTPNGQVSGGMATPMAAPTQSVNPAQSLIPNINIPAYQTPEQQLGLEGFYDYMNQQLGGYAGYAGGGNVGGISHLGDYSDGGRLLKGPGDGVSDSIPASIGGRQPARLADGEFVVPARIVSELGNGSTEAGARKLYAMMDRIQKGRRKSVGKGNVAVNSKADKHLPA